MAAWKLTINNRRRLNLLMFFPSNTFAQSLVALFSLVILASAILPGGCPCHQSAVITSYIASSHDCCRTSNNLQVSTPRVSSDDCCCKRKQPAVDALLVAPHPNHDSTWQPLVASESMSASLGFLDYQSHFAQNSASTFPATGPPLYLLHRALLL